LNEVRLAKKHHMDFPFDMYIVGIDKQRRMIHFMSISLPTEYFAVQLNSPPPTHHDSDLENAVLVFVSNKLGCQTRQISRGANGEEARDFYERLFQIDEGWFRQADDLERPPS